MKEKKWMLQYFHERTCQPQPLEAFEREAKEAAALGAEYIFISEIPKRKEEWTDMEGDPYPNWGMLQTSLFKLAVPKALERWLDKSYAERNRRLLAGRAEIARRYGLKTALVLIDPFYLPEEAYLAHPAWRGPRCDHPRRSRKMYFAPCVDNEEVRALYREALEVLFREVDLHYIQIITNDSGTGICWSDGLYNGKNGPASCRDIPMADRLAGFLQVFSDCADGYPHGLLIDLTSDILGYKAPDAAMEQSYGRLKEGQMLSGRDRNGIRRVFQYQFHEYEHVRPLKNLAFPIALTGILWEAQRSEAEWIRIIVPESNSREYEAVLRAWRQQNVNRYQDLSAVLESAAVLLAGEENASDLLEAWAETQEAMQRLKDMHYDNVVMMPLVSQRLINRPLVPFPERLTEEESAYYRQYLFQATTKEQAQDYMNIQGMEFVRGFTASRMVCLMGKDAVRHLEKSIEALERMKECSGKTKAFGIEQITQRRVLICLLRTLIHAVRYQAILDRTDQEEQPAWQTVWPVRGDERLLEMNEICRAEIDNTYALYGYAAKEPGAHFVLAEKETEEDIFLLSPKLPEQLIKKAEIMLAHMRDAELRYESTNR